MHELAGEFLVVLWYLKEQELLNVNTALLGVFEIPLLNWSFIGYRLQQVEEEAAWHKVWGHAMPSPPQCYFVWVGIGMQQDEGVGMCGKGGCRILAALVCKCLTRNWNE